jgi:hypothetical protein
MNIFVLDLDPQKCAEYHCNKHLVKMIIEHNQILGSIAYTARGIQKKKEITESFIQKVFPDFPRKDEHNISKPYGIGYVNHPCTKWAGESLLNYAWLCDLNMELCKEYTNRYKKIHSGESITQWYIKNCPDIPVKGLTPFPQAMPDDCKDSDVVTAYRNYYNKHKVKFAKWPEGKTPFWWDPK